MIEPVKREFLRDTAARPLREALAEGLWPWTSSGTGRADRIAATIPQRSLPVGCAGSFLRLLWSDSAFTDNDNNNHPSLHGDHETLV
jgi:hypothetical protein